MERVFKLRVPTVREKSVKNEKSSRSGKSQGILS